MVKIPNDELEAAVRLIERDPACVRSFNPSDALQVLEFARGLDSQIAVDVLRQHIRATLDAERPPQKSFLRAIFGPLVPCRRSPEARGGECSPGSHQSPSRSLS
jgi:hypothetical protein